MSKRQPLFKFRCFDDSSLSCEQERGPELESGSPCVAKWTAISFEKAISVCPYFIASFCSSVCYNHVIMRFGFLFLSGLLFFGHKTAGITLAWDSSPTKGITRYRIYYTDITAHKAAKSKIIDVGITTHAVVPNLVVGHTYEFVVTAFNSAGRESAPSNRVKSVVAAHE
jgi:Fibronectin type III domain